MKYLSKFGNQGLNGSKRVAFDANDMRTEVLCLPVVRC